MLFLYGLLTATAAIIAAQSYFKYTLDLNFIGGAFKKLFLSLFGKKPLK